MENKEEEEKTEEEEEENSIRRLVNFLLDLISMY